MERNDNEAEGPVDLNLPRPAAPHGKAGSAFLGFAVDELAGLSVDELAGNKVAVTMVLHYYKQLAEENSALKNERNTLSTYVESFGQKKSDARTGAILAALSTVFTGAGINLITSDMHSPVGYIVALPGIAALIAGLYFSLRDGEK
jgi:hypothetical protein